MFTVSAVEIWVITLHLVSFVIRVLACACVRVYRYCCACVFTGIVVCACACACACACVRACVCARAHAGAFRLFARTYVRVCACAHANVHALAGYGAYTHTLLYRYNSEIKSWEEGAKFPPVGITIHVCLFSPVSGLLSWVLWVP